MTSSKSAAISPVAADAVSEASANLAPSLKQLQGDINANAAPSIEAIRNSLFLNGSAPAAAFPPFPPFPLGLGLPGLFNGGGGSGPLPPLPDPGLLSLYAGFQAQGLAPPPMPPPPALPGHGAYAAAAAGAHQASASELLKKLQAKVQGAAAELHACARSAQQENGRKQPRNTPDSETANTTADTQIPAPMEVESCTPEK